MPANPHIMNAWAVVKKGKIVTFPVTNVLPYRIPAIYSTRKAARHFCPLNTGEKVVPCRIILPANLHQ